MCALMGKVFLEPRLGWVHLDNGFKACGVTTQEAGASGPSSLGSTWN